MDTAVWDEPFYAYYLHKTGLHHPMRTEVIESGDTAIETIIDKCIAVPTQVNRHGKAPDLWFQKHMTVHMVEDISLDWLSKVQNAFLIRRPEAVLASYHDRRANPTADDVGFKRQRQLFERVIEMTGNVPPVIDSDDVLRNPEKILRLLCKSLGIEFDSAMLAWPPGKRSDDGVWASHWYESVEQSTGFAAPRAARPLPDHLRGISDACLDDYEMLAAKAIR